MVASLEVGFKNMAPSDAVNSDIRARVDKLDQYFAKITHCHVTVEAPHRHHRTGRQYHVRVVASVPGRRLVVSNDPGRDEAHEDVLVALRDTFAALTRQLKDYVRTLRREVKVAAEPQQEGKVIKLFPEDGYGFIDIGDEGEVYFHRNSVIGDAFAKLTPGSRVAVVVAGGESEYGAQASTVRPHA